MRFLVPGKLFQRTYVISPVSPPIRNVIMANLESRFCWNLVYSFFGSKVRDAQGRFFIFAKIGLLGPKTDVFWPKRPIFARIKKRPCASLTFDPKKLYTKFQQNPFTRFAVIALPTDRRTFARTGVISYGKSFSVINLLKNLIKNPTNCHSFFGKAGAVDTGQVCI